MKAHALTKNWHLMDPQPACSQDQWLKVVKGYRLKKKNNTITVCVSGQNLLKQHKSPVLFL